MPSPEYDLRYLEASLPELQAYLLSGELYWPLEVLPPPGEPAYPRLTLGNLLLSAQRLHGLRLDSAAATRRLRLETHLETEQSRWRTAWSQKAAREFSSRLRQWGSYLEEYRRQTENQAAYFPYEVRLRLLLALLADSSDFIPAAELELLEGLDALLRAALLPGEFVWEAELAPSFPPEPYWYLYGSLKTTL